MRRGCLIAAGVLLLLCVGVAALGWFVGLPSVRGGIRDGIEQGFATEVAGVIPATPGLGVAPGGYTVTEEELERRLRAGGNVRTDNPNDLVVRLSPVGIELGFTAQGQDVTYTGRLAAEAGRLALRDMETDNPGLAFVLPPDDLGGAIADAVNAYLAANGLRLESIEPTDGAVTLTTAAATP